VLGDLEVREPGPGELAIDVAAAGLNRADLLQRRGLYPPPRGFPADVPGLEFAGTVAAIGADVQTWRPGDRVMGILGGGGMATRVIVHERQAIPVPQGLSLAEAAAIPEVFLTAFDALLVQAAVRPGEHALIHAVGSGVGTALLQLALVAGALPIGTSRTADKIEKARALGLTHGLCLTAAEFAESVQSLTGGAGADVVLDPVGGAYLEENIRALAERGRLVMYGTMAGISGELPVAVLLHRRAQVIGTVLRARPLEEKAALSQRFRREAIPLFESGRLHPVVAQILPMTAIQDAHAAMEQNDTFGKIVLTWDAGTR
jgi:putative PIG3 family NAD(P)H quinone oxidoreductase